MKLFKKLLCKLGFHKYGDWYPVDYCYDGKVYIHEHKRCERCGTVYPNERNI